MRNLKRVLSLALAVVMVIGMMVMTTGAADIADIDDVKNVEAVEVMAALGVLEGDENGVFNPTGILTREQAAKIIAYMKLGPANAEMLTGTSSFTDVEAGRWSESFIAYCDSIGIIAGNGDGTFNPTGELTGVAFAKMLLVALGYDAKIEGYVNNTNWATNIGADAVTAGVTSRGAALDVALTRDNAAQMAFNALNATLVGYTGGTDITTADGTSITVGAIIGDVNTAADVNGIPNDQFYEQHFPTLVAAPTYTDLGRPATTWKYGATIIGTYDDQAPVLTWTESMSAPPKAAMVAKQLLGYTFPVNGTIVVTNGTPAVPSTESAANIAGYTGQGTQVEVYADRTGAVTEVVIIETYLAKIVAKDAVNESVSLSVTVGATPYTGTVSKTTNKDFLDAMYAMDTGSYVLLNISGTMANGFTISNIVGEPGTATGTYTALKQGTYTIGGEGYKAAAKTATVSATLGSSYDLILDQYGNIMRCSAAVGNTNYAAVIAKTTEGNPMSGVTYYAQLLFTDGSLEWVNMTSTNGETKANVLQTAYTNLAVGDFVAYAEDGAGYDLVEVAAAMEDNTETGTIAKDTASYGGYTATNNTVFLIYNAGTRTYTAYTGLKDLPVSTTVTGGYVLATATPSGVAKIVVAHTVTAAAAADVVYLYDTTVEGSYYAANGDTVKTYNAIVNGVVTTIDAKNGELPSIAMYMGNTYGTAGYISTDGSDTADTATYVLGTTDATTVAGTAAPAVYKLTPTGANSTTVAYADGVLTLVDSTKTISVIVNDGFAAYSTDTSDETVAAIEIDSTGFTVDSTGGAIYLAVDANGYLNYIIVVNA